MNSPYLFCLTKKSQQDKKDYNPQNTIRQGKKGSRSQRLQTQQGVKNPGHASLDRKNAFADGLGQIIFTLDVYRYTTCTSYLIKSRVALDPPPYPTCPQLPGGSTRNPLPGSLLAARILRAIQFGSISAEFTESFACFPSCPNFPGTFHRAECKHAEVLCPPTRLQRLRGNCLHFFPPV